MMRVRRRWRRGCGTLPSMPKPGRNDPCPCGSGRKHKNCCGKIVKAPEVLKQRIHRADLHLRNETIRWVVELHGEEILDHAWDEFSLGIPNLEELDEEALEHLDMFSLQWWIHCGWLEEDSDLSPAQEYLQANRASADSIESRLARAAAGNPPSLYRVAGVDPGRSLTMEDFLTGERYEAREDMAAVEAVLDCYVYAHLVVLEGVAVLLGAGSCPIPPSYFLRLKEFREILREEYGAGLDREALRLFEDEIRLEYFEIMLQVLNPAPMELSNMDGEPIVPTRLIYDLSCSCEEAFKKLWTLSEGYEREEMLAEAERDRSGKLKRVEFGWIREGPNPASPAMPNTGLGFLTVTPGRLEVEVNSRERAERIRGEIEKRLGERAKFRHEVVSSVEKMMEEAREPQERGEEVPGGGPIDPGELMKEPEARKMIEEYMARHWETWYDESIPALEDMTPREAAKTAEGRELLEALLADYRYHARKRPDDPANPDFKEIRRNLGLPEE